MSKVQYLPHIANDYLSPKEDVQDDSGVKATVITNLSGLPLKMIIAPGSEHDLSMMLNSEIRQLKTKIYN